MTIEQEVRDRIGAVNAVTIVEPDEHMKALLRVAGDAVKGLDPHADLLGALRAVVGAERLLRIAFELVAQRQLGIAQLLVFARVAARDVYQTAIRSARSLGIASLAEARWPEPAVLLEPMATPVTYVRGSRAHSLGLAGDARLDLPFPVVLIPWYPQASLGALSVIHHEVGHNLDEDLGLTAALAPVLARLPSSPQRIDVWTQWCREIVADMFGFMYAGTAFLRVLADWSVALSDAQDLSSTTHPYPAVRVAMGCEVMRLLGVAPGVADPSSSSADIQSFIAEAPMVTRAVLQSPLSALANAALLDLAPPLADDERRLQAIVQAGITDPLSRAQDAAIRAVPLRLMPPLARLAIDAEVDPILTAKVLFESAAARNVAATAPFLEESYAQTTRRVQATPILDEAEGGYKRPPPDLFKTRMRFAFVGATNDSLPALFRSYLEAGGARKQRVEIYFLSLPAVRRLACPARTADELEQLQVKTLDALDATAMSSIAESWRIAVHDEPYFFAAYFNADRPGGRIHTSAHGWGHDLKRAPAVDFVWPETAPLPSRTYQWYLDSLAGLSQRATVVRSS
jgi:hypothetical protein